jgi:hypothetical protein
MPAVIAKILTHLQCTAPDQVQAELPMGRGRRRCSRHCFEAKQGVVAEDVVVGDHLHPSALRDASAEK